MLSYGLERDPERARSRNFAIALKRLGKLSSSVTPALVRDPIHIDRALGRSREGDFSQGRDLVRLTERVRDLATELTKIGSFPNSEGPVRDFKAMLQTNPAVLEAIDEALDIVLTRSLQNEDISMLVHDLQGPAPRVSGDELKFAGQALREEPMRISGDGFEFAALALMVLLSTWEPQRTKHRSGQAWAQFEEFLVNLFPASAGIRPTIPDEVEFSLQDVTALLVTTRWDWERVYRWEGQRLNRWEEQPESAAAADVTRDRQSWRILARRLASMSEAAAGTIVRHPARAHTLGPAIRIGLLAVIAVADQLADKEISAILRGVYSSLTCIDARRNDPELASEVTLLVRT